MADVQPPQVPGVWYGFLSYRTRLIKTANYTIAVGDNGAVFDNTGATGSITFTLPTLAANFRFWFRNMVAQTITVSGASGKMIGFNNATATSIALSTGGQQIGGILVVESLPDASAWFAYGLGPNTVTMS